MSTDKLKIFESFAQEAVQQCLPDFQVDVIGSNISENTLSWSEDILVSIMTFHCEKIEGTAVLGSTLEFLEKTFPGVAIAPDDPIKLVVLHDWLGELSNLVVGRIKNKLLPHGVTIQMNPPSVTEATEQIFEAYARRKDNIKIWFKCEWHNICLLLSLDIDETFEFAAQALGSSNALQPGDAIYRLNDLRNSSHYDMVSNVRSQKSVPAEMLDDLDFELDLDQMSEATPVARADLNFSKQPKELPAAKSRGRALEGFNWGEKCELCLHFSGKHTIRISPLSLLAQGIDKLTVEGHELCILRTQKSVQIDIYDLGLSLETDVDVA